MFERLSEFILQRLSEIDVFSCRALMRAQSSALFSVLLVGSTGLKGQAGIDLLNRIAPTQH
jgi:hypothetical protein